MEHKILIIDDEPDIVAFLEESLRGLGYQVLSATDGLSGLELARRERPNLLILDLMLPKMDGYRVCALLKNDTRFAKIPIILFSSRAQEEDIQLGHEMGACAYVTKPFNPQTFFTRIEEILKN